MTPAGGAVTPQTARVGCYALSRVRQGAKPAQYGERK